MTSDVWLDLPLIVISAADSSASDRAHHEALAARSTRGTHVVADSGGHYVHYDRPELVVATVRGMIAGPRTY